MVGPAQSPAVALERAVRTLIGGVLAVSSGLIDDRATKDRPA